MQNYFGKFQSSDLIDISEFLGGKWLKIVVSILYIFLFLIFTGMVLRNFSDVLKSIFMQTSPTTYIIIFFIIGIIIANRLGFCAISKVNLIITILVFIGILVIFFASATSYVPANLFPILGNGINETFFSGLIDLFAFGGIVALYFILPFLNKPKSFNKISVISVIISSIYLLLSVVSLLLLFSFVLESEEMLPILLATRIIRIGEFFQRVDAIFIFIWILTFLSYLSITSFFAIHIFKKVTNIKNQQGMIYCFAAIIFALSLIPQKMIHSNFLEEPAFQFFTIFTAFIIPLVLLILANIKLKKQKRVSVPKE